jgi:serine/threonine protein kinase
MQVALGMVYLHYSECLCMQVALGMVYLHYSECLCMQVALGMVYLHSMEQPLLHLDLKSANVLLDKNRTAKVCP